MKQGNKRYFFCYSSRLSLFLRNKGFKFITEAKHKDTRKTFWFYEGTGELNEVLIEYDQLKVIGQI